MRILICGYRDWVNSSIEILKNIERISIDHLTEPTKLIYQLSAKKYDLIFFIGWSWIVPKDIVSNNYCICIHPSPLPKYRGGSPLQHQIIAGESNSAVTFFKMTDKIDAGPVILQCEFSLEGDLIDIFERISNTTVLGLKKILEIYPNLALFEQDESVSTYFNRRTPDESEITLGELENSSAKQLFDKIRCLQKPYPTAYIKCSDGSKLYLLKVKTEVI
jgi:methionyl-tRNA formyltransferase